MKKSTLLLIFVCITLSSGCVSLTSENVVKQYGVVRCEYRNTLASLAKQASPENKEGIELFRRVYIAIIEIELPQLRFLLDVNHEAISFQSGDAPWIYWEIDEDLEKDFKAKNLEYDQIIKNKNELSDKWTVHQSRKEVLGVLRDVRRTDEGKKALRKKDDRLNLIILDIKEMQQKKSQQTN